MTAPSHPHPSVPPVAPVAQSQPASQRRLSVATVFAAIAAFLQIYSTQPMLPRLRSVFAATEIQVSLTVSALTIGVALASPLVGMLADVLGRRRVIVPACFLLALATLLSSTSQTLWQFIAWRFVEGLFVPGIIAVVIAYIAEEALPGTAARVNANYVTATVAGGLIGRLSAAVIADHLGWRSAFLFTGTLTLICAIIVALWLPPSRHFKPTSHPLATLRAMLQHLRNPVLIATYAVGFNVLFSLVGTFTYANFLLAGAPFHLSTTALGLVFLVYALGLFVTPAAGPMIDRIGHRRAQVVASVIVVSGAALTLLHSLPAVIIGLAILSTGVFISQSTASSHAATASRHTRSAATGLYVCFYYLGGSAGATTLGYAWRYGEWRACIAVVLAVQFVAAALAYRFFTRPAPPPDPQLTPATPEMA